MALERRERNLKAMQNKPVMFLLELTSTGTAVATSAGDVSLVSSVTDVNTGEFALVLRQMGRTLVGASAIPMVATPGTTKVQSIVLKSLNSSTKTVTFVMLKGDGSVADLDSGDKVYVTLIFNDSSVST